MRREFSIMPKVKSKRDLRPLPVEPIPFVRPSATESSHHTSRKSVYQSLGNSLNGKDVRSFYESVVRLHEDDSSCEKHHTKETSRNAKAKATPANKGLKYGSTQAKVKLEAKQRLVPSEPTVDFFRLRNCLLSAAEKGDIGELQHLLKHGADVNCQDQYGWTALMCAAHSGQSKAVTYLLDSGGDASIRNSKGQSAWDIAHLAKNHKVLHAITNHCEEQPEGETVAITGSFMCEICQEKIDGSTREKHCASTVHQLNMAHPVNDTAYGIPGHNRGFQLMLKSGWDQDKGLGPSGTGQKYPIKTHLKRDRKGLGVKVKDSKPRVTHFQPFDKKAVEHKHRQERIATLSKRAASKKARKDKEKEKQYRMEWASFD